MRWEPLQGLTAQGQVQAFFHRGFWQPMDTIRDKAETRRTLGQREGTVEDVVNPWLGRRVFLTGHTGFKGSWLSLWLARRGAKVRGYALDPATDPNLFRAASIAAVLDDVRGDIRDTAKLDDIDVRIRS